MKIQFSDNEIRIRISHAEFEQLKLSREFDYSLDYLALAVKLNLVARACSGKVDRQLVQLFLTDDDLLLMASSDSKKSGVKLLLQTTDGTEVAADLQVDLHSK